MKNYTDHATKVTIPQAAKNLWTNLSDFWQNFDDTDLISSAWSAWLQIVNAITSMVETRYNDVTIFSDVYSFPYNQVPVELILDTSSGLGFVIQGYDFRDITQLQDFINNPENVYIGGTDYTYSTPLKMGQPGYIDTTNELPETVWAFYVQDKTLEELIARFGVLVDYSYIRNTEEQTKKDILGLMQAQEFGSIIQHIECALCIENNFPFTVYGGTVIGVNGTDSLVLSLDDGIEVIENTTGLPFRYRQEDGDWGDIAVGDYITGPSQVIEAVTINDIVSDSNFYKKLPISDIERYHTFIVKFNPNLPHNNVSYAIDLKASAVRVERLKKITSKPYFTIMFDFAVDASTVSTSYVDLDGMEAALESTSYTNLLIKMNGEVISSYGFALEPLGCLLTSSYGFNILPLGVSCLSSSFGTIGSLPGFLEATSYGGT